MTPLCSCLSHKDGGLQLGVDAFVSHLPSSPRARSHSLRPGGSVDPPTVLTLWLLHVAHHLTFHNPIYLKWRYIDLYKTRVKNLGETKKRPSLQDADELNWALKNGLFMSPGGRS